MRLEFSLVLWNFLEHTLGQSIGREIRKDLATVDTVYISGKATEK